MLVFKTPHELKDQIGADLGVTDWLEIDQKRINTFAEATGDDQWIHVDEEKAKAGPFGSTIAHGYLTVSLVNYFLPQLVEVQGTSMGVNYGCNKVRFPAPVPVDSRVRMGALLQSVEDVAGGVQYVVQLTFECEGAAKPSCVAECIYRAYA